MQINHDTYYCPPLPLLWAGRSRGDTPAGYVHKIYARELWRERGPVGRALVAARFALWPLVVPGLMAWMTWRNGAAIRERTGRPVARQLLDQLVVAVRYGILPPWYYMFELFHENNRRRAGEYIHRYETKRGTFALIKEHLEHSAGRGLNHKTEFAARCRRHGLPAAPVVYVVRQGSFYELGADSPLQRDQVRLPGCDLFMKPTVGNGGLETLRASYLGQGRYQLDSGEELDEAGLIEHLSHLPRKRSALVEWLWQFSPNRGLLILERLVNHEAILDLTAGGALSCVRAVTCRNETDGFELTDALFRMAIADDTIVDGFHRGGVASRVDIETGELGPATNLGLDPEVGWRERHPNTRARIAGRRLPLWDETRELAIRAHATAFPEKAYIGWDIAITPDGPVLVEGNASPCVDLIQRPEAEPLGAKRFGELLAYHLRCAIEARDGAAHASQSASEPAHPSGEARGRAQSASAGMPRQAP